MTYWSIHVVANEKYKIRKIREDVPSIPALLEELRKNSDDDNIGK